MELISKTTVEIVKLEGVDFSGEAEITNGVLTGIKVELQTITTIKHIELSNQEQFDSIAKEFSKLQDYINKNGHAQSDQPILGKPIRRDINEG